MPQVSQTKILTRRVYEKKNLEPIFVVQDLQLILLFFHKQCAYLRVHLCKMKSLVGITPNPK